MADLIEAGARVYAEALFRAAEQAGKVSEVDHDLSDFLESLAGERGALRSLLNPRLPLEAKRRIVAAMLERSQPLLRNAVLVLLDNGRLPMLGDVATAYAELAADQENILDVEVTTAVELGEAATSALERRIQEATGQSARLSAHVEPEVLGGLVLRARGVLLDASVRRELDEIREVMINTPLPVGSEA